jgi:predicted transcriptional regulator of viral defense system
VREWVAFAIGEQIYFYNSVFLLKKRIGMTFLEFQNAFSEIPVIATSEVEKMFPGYDRNALTRWQKAGYLEKIRNGLYRFPNQPIQSAADTFFIANRVYQPSYVSLHSALNWYGFIPEGVFTITSITTKKTNFFNTNIGNFSYQKVDKKLFFGYRLENAEKFRFKIADPAKALLDLLYLFPGLQSNDHFFELRLHFSEINEKLNWNNFANYLAVFNSKSMTYRANCLRKFLSAHDVAI